MLYEVITQCKEHLQTLGQIAKKLSDKNLCRQLRLADSDEMLYQLITAP